MITPSHTTNSFTPPPVLINSAQNHQAEKSSDQTEQVQSHSTEATNKSEIGANFDAQTLVEQLYEQISQRIDFRAQTGQDSAELKEQAKAGISQGFAEAKEIIDAFSPNNDTLMQQIDAAEQQLLTRFDQSNEVMSSTVDSSLQQQQSNQFSLSLSTREGDQITLLFSSEHALKASQQTDQFSMQLFAQEHMMWQVEGDLNAEEKEDIQQLLGQIAKVGAEFYAGDMQTAFEMAQALSIDHTSLQQMQLNMQQYKEQTLISPLLPHSQQALQSYSDMSQLEDSALSMGQGQESILAQLADWLEQAQELDERFSQLFDQAASILPEPIKSFLDS